MPIRPFLAGQAFEPEIIRQMSLALENVCAKFVLPLNDVQLHGSLRPRSLNWRNAGCGTRQL